MGEDGKESFCFGAIHTHDHTGILHLAIDPANDLTFGSFLKLWDPTFLKNKDVRASVRVNGDKMSLEDLGGLKVEYGTDIKIFLETANEPSDSHNPNQGHRH